MSQKQNYPKFSLPKILGILALGLGTVGTVESRAIASPDLDRESWEIAQVGVYSRVKGPTPLNLTPRTHIPLPTTSRSRRYRSNRHRVYYGTYRSRSSSPHYRRYRDYDRYKHRSEYYRDRYEYNRHRHYDKNYGNKKRGSTITIFF